MIEQKDDMIDFLNQLNYDDLESQEPPLETIKDRMLVIRGLGKLDKGELTLTPKELKLTLRFIEEYNSIS